MKPPVGDMRVPAEVLLPTVVTDSSGGQTTTYVAQARIFVSLRPVTARERESFGMIESEVDYVIHGHWHALKDTPSDARLRVIETGQTFDIVGMPVNSAAHDWTRLHCLEREND